MIRVQHVDTEQPHYEAFHVASVSISTAATTHIIPALSEENASDFRRTGFQNEGRKKMMFEERRLHPAATIFNILKVIKELFFSLLIVLVAGNFLIFSIALGAFSILASVYGILFVVLVFLIMLPMMSYGLSTVYLNERNGLLRKAGLPID